METDGYAGTRAIEFTVTKGVTVEPQGSGMVVRGVTLLSPGIWVDSAIGTPLKYTEDALREYAGNWENDRLWSVHTGGLPRRITTFIGQIENQRFEDNALKADLFFHLLTDESKDTFALVKGGIDGIIEPVSFSIEHEGKEEFKSELGYFETTSLLFQGGAIVDEGASAGTKIMGEPEGSGVRYLSRFKQMDTKELQNIGTQEVMKMDEELKQEILAMIKEALAEQSPGEPPKEMAEGGATPDIPVEEVKAVAEDAAKEVVADEVEAKVAPIEEKVVEIEKKVAELSKQKVAAERTLSKGREVDTSNRIVIQPAHITTGSIGGM